MSASSNTDIPDITERAEEVRAYLVAIRGGAPFLSAPDGRLLIRWLESGWDVLAITAAIDRAAARRRNKRLKTRLSLQACVGEMKKARPVVPVPKASGLAGWVDEVKGLELSQAVHSAHLRLVTTVSGGSADGAVVALRVFHEETWNLDIEHRDTAITQAEQHLEALRESLDEQRFSAAVEEVARDLFRQRFPLLSAQEVWARTRAG